MIENNRDEELCRKWDALADEDQILHLTPQEHSCYKSNWWLHSNKQGSNTVRTTYRSDFKNALSTLQQLKQKEGALQTPTDSHRNQQMGTKFFFHGGIGKIHGGLLILVKFTREMKPSTDRTGRLVVQYLAQLFWARLS